MKQEIKINSSSLIIQTFTTSTRRGGQQYEKL
jgi:hypothetical protein